MNLMLLAASLVAVALAIAHSVIGEVLIFKTLRQKRAENAEALRILSRRRWDALWSTWHLLTIFGFGFAAVLFVLAGNSAATSHDVQNPLVATFLAGSVFWIAGTRGRHPAWIVLLILAALVWWA